MNTDFKVKKLKSFNKGNHHCDGVWISDLNNQSFYDFKQCLTIVNKGKWLQLGR